MNDLWILFLRFFQIGAFTFGGGFAMLALVQQESMHYGWISQQELLDFLAVSESTPGSFAVNIATFIGNKVGSFTGAVIATIAVVLPSFLFILALNGAYAQYRENRLVKAFLKGIKPCIILLIASAAITLLENIFVDPSLGKQHLFAASLIILMAVLFRKKYSALFLIILSACLGILGGYLGFIA